MPLADKLLGIELRAERKDGFWRGDVFHRLFDDRDGTRPRARSTRVRVGLGTRAFAYSQYAQDAAGHRRRTRQAILRCDGPVRDLDCSGDGDEDIEGRD